MSWAGLLGEAGRVRAWMAALGGFQVDLDESGGQRSQGGGLFCSRGASVPIGKVILQQSARY
jgi:hypothetical protein